jgi:hypothetical protein
MGSSRGIAHREIIPAAPPDLLFIYRTPPVVKVQCDNGTLAIDLSGRKFSISPEPQANPGGWAARLD